LVENLAYELGFDARMTLTFSGNESLDNAEEPQKGFDLSSITLPDTFENGQLPLTFWQHPVSAKFTESPNLHEVDWLPSRYG